MNTPDLDVAVIGAGLAGLATAHRLGRAGRSVRVFEAAGRVGGRMAAGLYDGCRIDEGAETIAARGYPATWRLIRAAGLTPADVLAIPHSLALWRDGRAHPNLGHPRGLLTGAGMSPRGRLDWLRFGAAAGRTDYGDLTVRQFAARYHPDLHDALLQPLAGCFFGWDTGRSAIAPMAEVLAATGIGSRWLTYRDGMDALARALANRVQVTLDCPLAEAVEGPDRAVLRFTDGRVLTARQAVLALPAPQIRRLRPDLPEEERPYLAAATYTPMLKVACLLDRPLPSPVAGYGVIVPATESRLVSGVIIDHLKAPGRAPTGRGLVSLLVAPAALPDLLTAPDAEVVTAATTEAARFLPGLLGSLRSAYVFRHPHGLPEATPQALRLRPAFLARPLRTIEYAGDWLPMRPNSESAAHSAELATDRVLAAYSRATTPATACADQ
ncbi:protoporphyrinogen/coproporphyrinogen oxidase [Kitasatospora viridis]|uniref:Oxygen-dependent protoporphyrinogen oxidase n=1 Tax=Kitasatospora viridis TaxID=281105 RepID=A0A561UI36_9ACTN|nr:NAD(P)/FAD-dependent oxidoreductase [Kitasatospora viridis]TWF99022.1 oxygen-dependent protoporphyrinogen oxidase [Kitasatospora viridis]